MNLIEQVLSSSMQLGANDVIQILGGICTESIDRDRLAQYPRYIEAIVRIVDFDTAVAMDGILGFLREKTGNYLVQTIQALTDISALHDAEILQQIGLLDLQQDQDAIERLAEGLYIYTDTDVWILLENYVAQEKKSWDDAQNVS